MPVPDGQLTSLLAMLRINANGFVLVGESIRKIRQQYANAGIIPDKEKTSVLGELIGMSVACERIGMGVPAEVLKRYIDELESDKGVTFRQVSLRISHWETTFSAELSKQIFFELSAREAPYFYDEEASGHEIKEAEISLGEFKEAVFDVREAGCCIALERPTAAVYHLMRASEHGLVAAATSIGVSENKRTSWEAMIGGIHSEVSARVSRKESGFKECEKKYGDLCAWFTSIKNGWRNPVT